MTRMASVPNSEPLTALEAMRALRVLIVAVEAATIATCENRETKVHLVKCQMDAMRRMQMILIRLSKGTNR